MRKFIAYGLSCIVVVIVAAWWYWCGVETVVVLARHADRLPGQTTDALAAAGEARSLELVHVLGKAGVDVIIRSDTNRAAQTAAPLAAAIGVEPIVLPPNDVAAIAGEVRNHLGETLFVVGHSNTVPLIIVELGGPELPEIVDTEFDNLFALTLCRCSRRPARLLNLQYGAVSP